MATGSDLDDLPPSSGRRPRYDLEEGEFVPDDDDSPYAFQHHHGGGGNDARPEIKRRRLEFEGIVVDGGAPPSPAPSSDRDSDGTISDVDADAGAASLALKPLSFPCPVCRREFTSKNAVSAHMRAHVPHRRQQGSKERTHARPRSAPISVGWAVTGKRGSVGGTLASPTPSSDRDSDGTMSDVDADAGAAASLAQKPLFFPCLVRRREFTSKKGLNGHMSAHYPHGRRQGSKERTQRRPRSAPITVGWAVTGKRGSVRRRSVPSKSEGLVDSMAMVVPEHVIDPMPIAFASRRSSEEPNSPSDASMAILVASSDDPTNQVVVHPPCSPQFLQGHQPAAPQIVVAQGQQLAEAAAPQFAVHQPAAPQVVQRTPRTPPARDEQGWWLCKEKGCDQRRFATHQGLRGHMAWSHKTRRNNEAAATDLRLGLGDAPCAKTAKLYPCSRCPSVFTSGYQLGGHMRKHCEKKHELSSAQATSLPMPPAAMDAAPPQPAVAPRVLRLFGVNIVLPGPPASATEEVSSAMTEADQSSAASTDIEQ